MSRTAAKLLILCSFVLAVGLAAAVRADTEGTAGEAAAVTSGSSGGRLQPAAPAAAPGEAVDGVDGQCAPASFTPIASEGSLPTPSPVQSCQFCNLTGFVNCESTDGTSCSGSGSKRCYINPPCACEWGICLCSGGTWNCYW